MRRPYIDWLRGIAVLIMIEWHTIDAWTADGERTGEVFKALAFLGGWAAPMFLFLAGVAIPLAANAQMARGASVGEVSWALQRRGWQVFLYAHLFRLQSWIINPYAVWHSIFKPDILNILGLGWVEGWRGDVLVALDIGAEGRIRRCHCHDPSWQNWPVLEHAVIGNIVPDFPLINKSFNLSYSGHDL